MTIALWTVSALLAVAFIGSGAMKMSRSRAELEPKMAWVASATDGQVKALGFSEVLGGIGLILPAATGIAAVLTPIAALALAGVMVGAIVVHRRMNDPFAAQVPALVLALLSLFVAWSRFVG